MPWHRPARLRLAPAFAGLGLLLAFFFAQPARAYTPPPIQGHVTDLAGKLSASEKDELEQRLEAVNRSSGAEIAVLIVASLQGETIEDVAYGTFNTWKLGKKDKDNGVLLVIAVAERRIRIETGKGVEGQLTDLQTQDIIQRQIGPELKQDHFFQAIRAGTDAIAAALNAQPQPGGGQSTGPAGPGNWNPLWLLMFGGVGIVLWFLRRARGRGFWMGGGGGWGGGGGGGGGFSGGGGASGGGGSSGSY